MMVVIKCWYNEYIKFVFLFCCKLKNHTIFYILFILSNNKQFIHYFCFSFCNLKYEQTLFLYQSFIHWFGIFLLPQINHDLFEIFNCRSFETFMKFFSFFLVCVYSVEFTIHLCFVLHLYHLCTIFSIFLCY